ncbi:pilus assembly protein [Myxococcus sp. K15C18031901]|uniref:TadE/TadG family type IV pilus assembly protein n=1 Tax=Myxococcus dinghuensis TaxID=2906761 RepID=UPI0020A6F611|nr:TadE family protein [Myxococcus dinghuensis]MCP3102127.1 pilus assembly protein [Myxococcus dinghuensis]
MHSTNEPGRIRGRQAGQAAVETAIIVPMMVFIILGIIQLGMVHNARLMTEYAVYRAVRSGIVNNGDCALMRRAALAGLLPTLAPLPNRGAESYTLPLAVGLYNAYSDELRKRESFYSSVGLPLMRVEVVNPKKSELDGLFSTYGAHLDQLELDYDDVRDDRIVEANLLSVRLTYFYELRIPFANWQLHSFYMGREFLDQLKGHQFESQRVGGKSATQYLLDRGAARDSDHGKIAKLARSSKGRYLIPLVATWSMRMQSNLLNNSRYGPGSCAVDN